MPELNSSNGSNNIAYAIYHDIATQLGNSMWEGSRARLTGPDVYWSHPLMEKARTIAAEARNEMKETAE
jgi:hypothetical protein